MSQEETVKVSELFRWIRASLVMARSGADFKCELSATVAARTLSAAVCGLLSAKSGSSSTGILKAQLQLLRDASFEWPSLNSLHPESLPTLPKNIAKNFDLELERMKNQVPLCFLQILSFFTFLPLT